MKILIITLALLVGAVPTAYSQARLGSPGYDAYEAGDYITALKHWTPLAEAGDADIQARIAMMYLLGEGTKLDAEQGAHWFMESAKQNFAKAQYNLGKLYVSGIGVEKDDVMGMVMLSAAVENGSTRATTDLANLIENIPPTVQSQAEIRLAEWWQAHPKPVVEEEEVEEDTRTVMQKFNDWLAGMMPEGMISGPR